jgi:single-strand DNA-binding protein
MHATAHLLGRLGGDPELRYTPAGKAVCSFSLAVDRQGKDEVADWWSVTLWEKQAEFAANNLKKGGRVLVEGRPCLNTWTNERGEKNSRLALSARTLQVIDWAETTRPASGEASSASGSQQAPSQPQAAAGSGLDEDPFETGNESR